jgi:hypothetical protein
MAQIGRINGVGVNIGYAGTPGGITLNDAGISPKMILQSADDSGEAENYEIMDEAGNLTISAWLNPQRKSTLELVITGAGGGDAITQTQLCENISPGDMLVISACAALPGLVKTNWEVLTGPKVAGTNKDAKKFTCNVRYSPGVTQQMPA